MAGPSSVRTRGEASTLMSEYLGKGKEMLMTELPTLRDCLRYGIFLKETDPAFSKKNTPTSVLVKAIMMEVKARWNRASSKFQPPITVQDKGVQEKLAVLWDKAQKISCKNITSQKEISRFEEQLDKLVDLIKCKCPIYDCNDQAVLCKGCHCQEPNCTGCPKNAPDLPPCHIVCTCPAKQKIPVLELPFIRAQRAKVGTKSVAMIVSIDEKESKKMRNKEERKLERMNKKERQAMKVANELEADKEQNSKLVEFIKTIDDIDVPDMNQNNETIEIGDEGNEWVPPTSETPHKSHTRNTKKIRNIAMASVRFGVSANATAAIANAALLDFDLISSDNNNLVIDAMKVQRAKDKLHTELQEKSAIKYREEPIICILFDGRKDWTRMYAEVEGSDQIYPVIEKEEHYSVVSEPGGQYLFHFTPPPADKDHKAAEQIAIELVKWMKEYGVDKTLKFIGGDSTNVNSGIWGGTFQHVEKLLGRPLNWIVCGLHLVELPLRHLIIELDGPTKSDTGFQGPLGKALDTVTNLPINKRFKALNNGNDMIELPDEIVKDLSTDQRYGYEICVAIRNGEVPDRLANLEIGPVNHARWNTTANRFCRMYVSNHGFRGNVAKNLKRIVEYIVGVYYPIWFSYKVRNHWLNGPEICYEQLHLTLSQEPVVRDIVLPHTQSSAWWANSEMLLQALLCSTDEGDRKFAVEKVKQIRVDAAKTDNQEGTKAVRTRHKVRLNTEAMCLRELIIWAEEEITEPVLTLELTLEEILKFESAPMVVPDIPVHGQSMERCVKEVTAAAEAVYGYDRRDGFIRARLEHRTITGGLLKSKKDHAKIVYVGQ